MNASTRFLIGALGMPLVVAIAAAVGVVAETNRQQTQVTLDALHQSDAILGYLRQGGLSALQAHAEGLAGDSAFVDYVAQAMTPGAGSTTGADEASISDLLSERRGTFDALMVLDAGGKPVGRAGVLLRDRATIPQDPLVVETSSTQKPTVGAWVDNGELQWVTVDPLLRDRSLQGMLLTATHVDTAFVTLAGRATGASVALVVQGDSQPPRVVATNDAGSPVGQSMTTYFDRIESPLAADIVMHASDGDHVGRLLPIQAVAGKAVLLIAAKEGRDPTSVPQAAIPFLGGIALLLLLSWIAAVVQWRRTYLPLQHLLDVTRLAAAGDYRVHARSQGSAIVVTLRDALNELLGRIGR